MEELKVKPQHKKYNLNKKERQALEDLQNDKSITIKPADKGGAIVLMKTTEYEQECFRHLHNPEHYTRSTKEDLMEVHKKVTNIAQYMRDLKYITERQYRIIIPKNTEPSKFYTIPKVHKQGMPGRPIASGTNCPIEAIAAYVDNQIRPYVHRIPSYIKDSTHFLNIIKDTQLDEQDLLVTIDVSALYTSIPHADGIKHLTESLQEFNHSEPPLTIILQLTRIILTSNIVSFKGELYKQVHGTAMGTRMAPSYACLFMYILEKNMLAEYPHKPKLWKRYIDDIFMIWPHGQEELDRFITYINNYHRTIKFTMESSNNSIPFLDVLEYRSDSNTLETTIYSKPTDSKSYLHYHSHHPQKQKESIPIGLMIRAKRICSEETELKKHLPRIKNTLENVKFPLEVIQKALNRIQELSREDLLEESINTTVSTPD